MAIPPRHKVKESRFGPGSASAAPSRHFLVFEDVVDMQSLPRAKGCIFRSQFKPNPQKGPPEKRGSFPSKIDQCWRRTSRSFPLRPNPWRSHIAPEAFHSELVLLAGEDSRSSAVCFPHCSYLAFDCFQFPSTRFQSMSSPRVGKTNNGMMGISFETSCLAQATEDPSAIKVLLHCRPPN